MSNIGNLWGELPLAEIFRTPIVILREQAAQLTELTNGLLVGQVDSFTSKARPKTPFASRLSIVVPALESYQFQIIRIYHNIMLYPLHVFDVVNEIEYDCDDEQQFLEVVGRTLSSKAVHKAIAALLSQSKSEI